MNQTETNHEKIIIMVVDDDPIQQLLISESICKEKYDVIIANNGQEALDKFIKYNPALIFLDVYMPLMNGFETCKAIRALDAGKYTAILMATGQEDSNSIKESYEAGATDFILKPINHIILEHRIRYILRSRANIYALHDAQVKNISILDALPDMMVFLNPNGIVLDYKSNFHESKQYLGKNIACIFPKKASDLFFNHIQLLKNDHKPICFEYSIPEIDAIKYYEARLVLGDTQIIAFIRDITQKKEMDAQLLKIAYYDTLTNLPNSAHFKAELEKIILMSADHDNKFSIIFLDLDRFKNINDSYGHTIGDKLLLLVVSRLKQYFKKSSFLKADGKNIIEHFSRFGGDEFVLLIHDNELQKITTRVSENIISLLEPPFKVGNLDLYVTPSIGIASFPKDGSDVDSLLKNATSAMYYSKNAGRNTFSFYKNKMNKHSKRHIELEAEIRKNLDLKQFSIYYQPQLHMKSNTIVGAEALLRLYLPDKGFIPPSQFVPLMEEIGLIEKLSTWVMEQSCNQMKKWLSNDIAINSISVNLSASEFRNKNLSNTIEYILRKSKLPSHFLDLELTETMIMQEDNDPINSLQNLKNLGVKLSIDDFGSGYSSLTYLKLFPIDCLKIDRAFVKNIDKNIIDVKIVHAIITMAHALQLKVICEGVETQKQYDILKQQKCDIMQGYYFAKPMPADEFEIFYRHYQKHKLSNNFNI